MYLPHINLLLFTDRHSYLTSLRLIRISCEHVEGSRLLFLLLLCWHLLRRLRSERVKWALSLHLRLLLHAHHLLLRHPTHHTVCLHAVRLLLLLHWHTVHARLTGLEILLLHTHAKVLLHLHAGRGHRLTSVLLLGLLVLHLALASRHNGGLEDRIRLEFDLTSRANSLLNLLLTHAEWVLAGQRLLLHLLLRDRLGSERVGNTVFASFCEPSDYISRILLRLVVAAEHVHEIEWIFCGTLLLLLTSVEVEVKVAILGLLLRADGGIEVKIVDVVVAGLLRLGVRGKLIKIRSKVDIILFIIFEMLMS